MIILIMTDDDDGDDFFKGSQELQIMLVIE
jgi:hypothetical protein